MTAGEPPAPPLPLPGVVLVHEDEVGRIVEIVDERTPMAEAVLEPIAEAFRPPDRQSLDELRSEIAEKRLDLLSAYDYHLLAMLDGAGDVMGTVVGVYLEGVNACFVTYLAVRPAYRGAGVARRLRTCLVGLCRADARRAEWDDLAWVLGEVRHDNLWLRRLIAERGAVVLELDYYHPGMVPGAAPVRYVLYRQPVGDTRRTLPAQEVRRVLFAVYRRGYRVRYPLLRDGFRNMLAQLEDREEVGPHPDFHPRG